MTTPKVWRIDVYEQGSRRNVMLRDDRCETTMEIDRDGDLLVEFDVDSESYGGGLRTVRAYYPVESVIEFLREAGPLASRSSSGSGEREAIHAIRDVWLSARTNDDTPPGCYLVDSEPMLHAHGVMLRALSSAPPSPDSGELVRALEEALRESRRCGDKLAKELRGWRDTYVSDDEEDPEGWLALDGWAKSSDARDRALSPQGDGGTER